MSEGLWGLTAGIALLTAGLLFLLSGKNGRRHRRARLCLLCGGCLFVLGVLFLCCPAARSGTLLGPWGGGTVALLGAHEWLSPRD